MHIKAKTLHILYAKKLKIVQNQEKSLWCILKLGGNAFAILNEGSTGRHSLRYKVSFLFELLIHQGEAYVICKWKCNLIKVRPLFTL